MKKEKSLQIIQELADANGVSGFEEEVLHLVKKYTHHIGPQETDGIKNLYIQRQQNTSKRPLLQFDAHSDEVGFIVQAIKPNGMLQFLTLGGWIPNNITAQKVRVRNREGHYINGVVSSKPPHFMTPEERNKPITVNDLFIDVGATSQQEIVEIYKIDIGAPVVPAVQTEYDPMTDRLFGKAFDCRIGCACMVDVLDELANDDLAFDLTATLSAQEEVGERGAIVAAQKVCADLAIVFEGCPADDTGVADYMIQSAMGKGPMLRNFDVSMITNPEFQQYTLDLAKKFNIPVQASVRSGGGTNASVINQVKGAPAIVVGIPVRYAHTPHCFVAYEDYQHAKQLVLELVRSLTPSVIQQLTHPAESGQ
ncbi:putative aminopeptidase FrvX [Enterococcus sp. PF1-24]|uniref:M42 family metallopeptidase n=1 Tax=unclassified Enterococcus TaxID=2608891 RepID=UPI0024735E14|nr:MULTISPECIES: M20/M25/M40 family metallo-hydrolase [unclassified Enterococcus]MDH6364588.1 putative aminopeptidase FrvX [Enterococcus sp. PFB1-1]MDH6401689.1 putative aminopeptidase FrvX [Enterococcus sp. PF1-24]